MNSSPRTQPVDLGRCLFRAIDLSLQLRLSATAQIIQQDSSGSTRSHMEVSQWQDLASFWVMEAPELDVRLFLKTAPGLKHTACTLVKDLGGMICNSSVWADLGFAVRHEGSDVDWDIESPWNGCIIFSLCREHRMNASPKGRTLPAVLQNPPEAHAPPGVSVITLASIDIQLEYEYPSRPTQRFCDLLALHVDSMMDLHQRDYPKMETFAVAALRMTEREPEAVSHEPELEQSAETSPTLFETSEGSTPTSPMWLQLLDLGLQKLTNSARVRSRRIRTFSKEDTLQRLPRLFPAVFNPGYRDAMNQRAASIPIISRALTSMLDSSNDPILKGRLATLLRNSYTSDSSLPPTSVPTQTIQSLLWRIAQDKIRHPKPLKRGASFFASDLDQETIIHDPVDPELLAEMIPDSYVDGHGYAGDFPDSELLFQGEFKDMDLIEMDQCDGFNHHADVECATYPHDQSLAEDELELMFEW